MGEGWWEGRLTGSKARYTLMDGKFHTCHCRVGIIPHAVSAYGTNPRKCDCLGGFLHKLPTHHASLPCPLLHSSSVLFPHTHTQKKKMGKLLNWSNQVSLIQSWQWKPFVWPFPCAGRACHWKSLKQAGGQAWFSCEMGRLYSRSRPSWPGLYGRVGRGSGAHE